MKLPKALNEATAGAALKYHIKRALERSHSISDFSKQLDLSAKNSQFSNNTLKIIEELNNGVKQASEELSKKASDLAHAITPLKEFGTNYPEFALKPKEALEKLLQEKNGQVAGAAYREDLGGIDFVWGNKDYGLAHILQNREKQYQKLGLTTKQAKERTNELLKEIPNILQKGLKEEDRLGYAAIILNNSRVILSKFKGNNELKNHYMITSYEVDDKVLRELETIAPLSNDYRDGGSISNLNEPNFIQKPLTSQEDLLKTQENTQDLSPLELAKAEKLAKLESEKLESGNKIFDFYSDRNFTDYKGVSLHPEITLNASKNTDENIINKKPLTSQENLLKTKENLFIPNTPKRYVRNHVRNADIIHSFIQPNRTAKSDDALSTVVVYGENTTKKPLTSQEDLPKTREKLFITETQE
ncbi:DUF3519 domain-containing protein [Helicobacter pylori]|nr:DUF3519 domain-containing protein [Helicobacter pylori]